MRSRIPTRGYCTGREDLNFDRHLVLDTDAPVMSGAEVIVVIRRRAGIVIMVKFLQWRASDGEWYFAAWSRPADVGDHSRIHAFHFDPATRALRREIEVLAVFAVVDEIRLRRGAPHLPLAVTPMAPGQLEAFDREGREVVTEWTRDGYPPPRRLEFDNDPQALLQFRSMDDSLVATAISNSIQSEPPEPPTSLSASAKPQAIEFNWSLGTFWTLNGITELWEYTANTPFSSATKIWEGRGTRVVITKADTTTRYYWVRMRTIGGQVSAEFGVSLSGNGLGAAARTSDTGDITDAAATAVYAATDTGPITVSLVGPSTSKVDVVKVVSGIVVPTSNCIVEVSASYRVGITGSGFTVKTGGIRVLSGVGSTFTTLMEKTTNAYEPQTIVSTFTQAAGTYDFGLGVDITGSGSNVDATFRDINVRVTVVKK